MDSINPNTLVPRSLEASREAQAEKNAIQIQAEHVVDRNEEKQLKKQRQVQDPEETEQQRVDDQQQQKEEASDQDNRDREQAKDESTDEETTNKEYPHIDIKV